MSSSTARSTRQAGARSGVLLVGASAVLALAGTAYAAQSAAGADLVRPRLEAGRNALARGATREAYEHFLRGLVLAPDDAALRGEILRAVAADVDARRLWALDAASAAADAAGKLAVPRELAALLPGKEARLARLQDLRPAAVQELLSFARTREKQGARAPEALLVALWARRLALELAEPAPALRAAHAAELRPTLTLPAGFHEPVVGALQRQLSAALAQSDLARAIRTSRVLAGLGTQAGFDDLQGPVPSGMDKVLALARQGLVDARDRQRDRAEPPWTIDDLEGLSPEEREAFTRAHASFAEPGVALSSSGLYRVETDCGLATLLGVARTVEDHHRRLALWYGRDPFAGAQGTVRVVPRADGLEAEGAPFWWVGGMQSGDVTTVRFSCGTIEGLGRTLTHELTHRFDGALYPGLPAWLAEGRAVWTAGAYGHSSDEELALEYADFGALEQAYADGYDRVDALEKLVAGTIDDYRDNYVAGFALYVYLESWEPDRPLYRQRLREYMEASRGAREAPLARFVAAFADGADGRPAGFEAFAAAFGTFVRGFYWRERQPWTSRYVPSVVVPGLEPWVYDEPTWVWTRNRAEPVFGEGQARLAAELLRAEGKREEALRAAVWACAADGRAPSFERGLAELLAELGHDDAAWAVRAELAGIRAAVLGSAPFARALPRTLALLEEWGAASESWRAEGLALAAAAAGAERGRLAARLGLSSAAVGNGDALAPAEPGERELLHPFDPPARHLGERGWVEDSLVGFEDRRAKGLWYVTPEMNLVVGAVRPASSTGRVDRNAYQQDAYARAPEWILPGSYRLRGRIRFTTAYVAGAIVLGSTRRDRDLRLLFSAGNFDYAIGESDVEPSFETLSWRLDALRERDPALAGSAGSGIFAFDRAAPSFAFELLVEGATLRVSIDGELVATYHTVDGAPLEGYVGFASGFGAFEVQEPTVERLERSRLAGFPRRAPLALDVAGGTAPPFEELANLPTYGFEPPVNGALVLWLPRTDPAEAAEAARALDGLLVREGAPQPLILAVPGGTTDEERAALEALLLELQPRARLVVHGFAAGGDADSRPDQDKRWILFLDPGGVVRFAAAFASQRGGLHERLLHWLRVFRDVGQPARDLPALPRPAKTPVDRDG